MSRRLSSAPPPVPGFELLRVIGRGAYGEVWLARSLAGYYSAIKIVWRDRFPNPDPYEHEFNGLKSFVQLSPHERRRFALLHVGRNDDLGFFYYVMELADNAAPGGPESRLYQPLTLKQWCQRNAPLSLRDIRVHAIQVTHALANLHEAGLVHRDIKPSNLLVIQGQATLADIGSLGDGAGRSDSIGTEGFVPPEGAGSTEADVYSLGKVLYELVTQRDRREFPRLPDNLSQHPERRDLLEFNEILVRACDPSPDKRHRDGSVLLKELLLLEAGGSVRELRKSEGRAGSTRVMMAMMVLVSIFGLGETSHAPVQARREAFVRRIMVPHRDRTVREIARVSFAGSASDRSSVPSATLQRAAE